MGWNQRFYWQQTRAQEFSLTTSAIKTGMDGNTTTPTVKIALEQLL